MNTPCVHRCMDRRSLLRVRRFLYLFMAVHAWCIGFQGAPARGDETLEYNRDIRPILAENCFACHGPDSASRKANLRLDRRDDAIEAGAITPGAPDESELVARILSDEPEERMPPPSARKTLTSEQKVLLRRWVESGAEYQAHWSYLPLKPPTLPVVRDSAWVRNPIDAFVLARLEPAGLAPAPEADRRALARRAALDITGLPPDPKDVDAFVRDEAADAYEKYVDRLLQSQHWGEHRARAWLDAARYADTHGFHFDNFREMWSYRDWVIDAFNRNMPFDQFTLEQLAGDLLPNRTLEQQIASGFNRCNMTTNEGGTIPEENLVGYARDRTETVSQVWLGLTMGCAVCHDHKFDPISQREFYELSAFFNNTTQGALDGNIRDTPPIIVVPTAQDRARWEELVPLLAETRGRIEERKQAARPGFEAWLGAQTAESLSQWIASDGLVLRARTGPLEEAAPAATPELQADLGDFEKDQPFTASVWIRLDKRDQSAALLSRMDERNGHRGWDFWIEGGRVGAHIVSKWSEDAIKVVSATQLPEKTWIHVTMRYDGSSKAAGVTVFFDGKPQALQTHEDRLSGSTRASVPLLVGRRPLGSVLSDAALHDVRLYNRTLTNGEIERLAGATRALELIRLQSDQRAAGQLDGLFEWYLKLLDEPWKALQKDLAALTREETGIKQRGTVAHVMEEKPEPATAYVLFRGEYDKRRDLVEPGVPKILPPYPSDQPRNRLGFAHWLLRPEHPLTARVTVNRFWQEVFGTGLVRTAGDFGVSGELPSHPELLDWLAIEFQRSGWDVKQLFKLMLTSSTYRQASVTTPEKLQRDPDNRLLSRGPRFRMEAEMVRDYALAASGLIVYKVGGPSVKPYQPDGVWEAVAMPESNTKSYRADRGENLYRRSLYVFWKRAAPPAMLETFNAPSRETCTVRRERTNTPLQALVTLNDPQFVEAARALAQRALIEGGETTQSRIDYAAQRVLTRSLEPAELAIVERSLQGLLEYYFAHPEDAAALLQVGESKPAPELNPSELAAWTMLANELMNLDEALNK